MTLAPGHPVKDVSDWFDAGHTVEELVALAQDTPSWSSESAAGSTLSATAMSINDILVAVGLDSLSQNPRPEAVESALLKLRDLVRSADPLRKAVVREAAVQILDRAGLRAPAALVDTALDSRESDASPHPQDQLLVLSDPEPWPEAVEGAQLLNDLLSTFTRFLRLPPGGAVALVLWTLHAHAHEAAAVSPTMVIKSATKRSGKTTAVTVLSAVVPRPLIASNVTLAAIFRTIDKFHPSLLIDEADSFLTANEEIRGILNSGHTRAGAVVIRTVGDDHEPRPFSTWCPKAIALIGNLPDTLEDRSLILEMRRRAAKEKVERLRLDRLQELEPLRRRAARWAKDNLEELRQADPIVPDQLHDRAADNWRPLLAIADRCLGLWPEEARCACLRLSGAAREEDNAPAIQLLADLRDLFRTRGQDRLSSKQIVEMLAAMEERPWPEWRNGKPLTETQLAKLLKPFGVKPRGIRLKDGTTPRGYLYSDLEDPFSRYLPPEVQQPQQSSDDARFSQSTRCNTAPPVAPEETDKKPRQMALVASVASPKGDPGEREHQGPVTNHGQPEEWEEI